MREGGEAGRGGGLRLGLGVQISLLPADPPTPMLFDFGKANVQWYPAHMKYGLDRMHKMLRNISLILEVRDARIHPPSPPRP